jgi:two-component system, LytTR family, response regulator
VGEAGRKAEALELIGALRPQLLFLDVRMRGGGGFEILSALEHPPAVVFVTAYDHYAVRAFEVNAMDYLLKPVCPTRLRATLARVRRGAAALPAKPLAEEDTALLPLGDSGHFVSLRDILFIEANGHYSQVTADGGRCYLVRQAFHTWQERLPAAMFSQLERGLILNHGRITTCSLGLRGGKLLMGSGSVPLNLGASAAKRLREILSGSQSKGESGRPKRSGPGGSRFLPMDRPADAEGPGPVRAALDSDAGAAKISADEGEVPVEQVGPEQITFRAPPAVTDAGG